MFYSNWTSPVFNFLERMANFSNRPPALLSPDSRQRTRLDRYIKFQQGSTVFLAFWVFLAWFTDIEPEHHVGVIDLAAPFI